MPTHVCRQTPHPVIMQCPFWAMSRGRRTTVCFCLPLKLGPLRICLRWYTGKQFRPQHLCVGCVFTDILTWTSSCSGLKGKCWAGRIPLSWVWGAASLLHRVTCHPAAMWARQSRWCHRPLPWPRQACREPPAPSTGTQGNPAPPTRSSNCCSFSLQSSKSLT